MGSNCRRGSDDRDCPTQQGNEWTMLIDATAFLKQCGSQFLGTDQAPRSSQYLGATESDARAARNGNRRLSALTLLALSILEAFSVVSASSYNAITLRKIHLLYSIPIENKVGRHPSLHRWPLFECHFGQPCWSSTALSPETEEFRGSIADLTEPA